ncbi:hypothetical protein MPSI1_001236 [Malassezia psittaci]|uniref:Transmembrane protein n=1 Tax=Malassezia psittaci TaxID=1821823 RepID=A0AAF0F860_9BASI|nr:hypothetical protein MPSI1_001236 [Malassezia psittaci]
MIYRIPHSKRDIPHQDLSAYLDEQKDSGMQEGVDHGNVNIPQGSQLVKFTVSPKGETIPVYWSANPNNTKVEHVFIMMHGKLRDGDTYWSIMNDIVNSARQDNNPGAMKDIIIAAPQMYSAKLNKGQYDNDTLAWEDVNTWQSGAIASHPPGTNLTSMDALDVVVDHFTRRATYPALTNITMVGHGGGAQLMNRYATTGKDPSDPAVYVRYVVGDPSSSPYFTPDRTEMDSSIANTSDCEGYNTWRYGFDMFTGTSDANLTSKDYFSRYIRRDVVNLVGLNDTEPNGDQKCMALLQGGTKRRDRNLVWWRYINTLARTNESLTGFPGNFKNLPDWSDTYTERIGPRLAIIKGAEHDPSKVFKSKIGRSVLFDAKTIETGWRPDKKWLQQNNALQG